MLATARLSLGRWLRSRWFLYPTLGLFLVQGVFLALALDVAEWHFPAGAKRPVMTNWGVSPDEFRHIGNIEYYAARGWFDGPVIDNANVKDLWLGEIERFGSYFYYYVFSFPYKLLSELGVDRDSIILIIRLAGVGIGLEGLLVFRSILKVLKVNPTVVAVGLFGLANTTAYVQMSSAVNYDMPALLLYLLLVYYLVHFYQQLKLIQLLLALSLAMLLAITKYTYIPLIGLGFGVLAYLLMRQHTGSIRSPFELFKQQWSQDRMKIIMVSLLLVVSATLFVERVGINVYKYQSVNPICTKLHSYGDCRMFDIFRRNDNAKQKFDRAVESGNWISQFEPFTHTGVWMQKYYQTMYFVGGHKFIEQRNPYAMVVGSLFIVASGLLVVRAFRVRHINNSWIIVGFPLVVYTAMVYVFNLNTYLSLGQYYAYSGRYLLPVVGFAYVLAAYSIIEFLRQRQSHTALNLLKVGIVALGLVAAVLHLPVVTFIYHAGPAWYSETMLDILPTWLIGAAK